MRIRPAGNNYSGYSQSKFYSELEVWRGIKEGLNAVIVNPTIIVGPGKQNSGSQRLFFQVNKGLKITTDGITGFVDVRDVVNIMIKLMNSNISGERFCINSENLSYNHVLGKIAEGQGKKAPDIRVSQSILNIFAYIEKIRSFLLRSTPVITKETAKSAFGKSNYSSEKIINALGYEFIPIDKSISDASEIFRKYIF